LVISRDGVRKRLELKNELTGTPKNEPHKTIKHAELVLPIPNQGQKYFGSTGTPKKSLAAKVEAKKREEAFAHQILGEAQTNHIS